MSEKAPWEEAAELKAQGLLTYDESSSPESPEALPTIEEMHPKLTAVDRVFLENFANNPMASAKYLEQKYPDLEIRISGNDLLMKTAEEKNYRVLDPDTGFSPIANPKEALYDIVDSGVDIATGTLSGMAGAAAGIFGGIPTMGVGALPAAMAASGATSYGLDVAKQKAGQFLGLPQNVDQTQALISGAGGLAGPALFGTGATQAQILKQAMGKGLGKTTSAALLAGQRGVTGRLYDAVKGRALPAMGEVISGIPSAQILTRAARPGDVKALQDQGILSKSRQIFDGLRGYFGGKKEEIGQQMEDAVENSDSMVDISRVKEALAKAREAAQNSFDETPNEYNQTVLKNLDDLFNEHFLNKKSVEEALDMSLVHGYDPVTLMPLAKVEGSPSQYIPDQVSAQQAMRMKDALNQSADMFDPKLNKMGGRLSGSKADKTLTLTAQDASQRLSKALGVAVPEMAVLNKAYGEVANTQKLIQADFKTPRTTAKTLQKLNSASKSDILPVIQSIDKNSGLGIMKTSLLMQTAKTFEKASKDALSSGGTTSTTRSTATGALGGGLGFAAGMMGTQNPYLASIMAGAGAFVGSKAASPAAMGLYIDAARAANAPVAAARNMGLGLSAPTQTLMQQYAAPSAWDLVSKREGMGK